MVIDQKYIQKKQYDKSKTDSTRPKRQKVHRRKEKVPRRIIGVSVLAVLMVAAIIVKVRIVDPYKEYKENLPENAIERLCDNLDKITEERKAYLEEQEKEIDNIVDELTVNVLKTISEKVGKDTVERCKVMLGSPDDYFYEFEHIVPVFEQELYMALQSYNLSSEQVTNVWNSLDDDVKNAIIINACKPHTLRDGLGALIRNTSEKYYSKYKNVDGTEENFNNYFNEIGETAKTGANIMSENILYSQGYAIVDAESPTPSSPGRH